MKTIEIEVNDDTYQRWMDAKVTYQAVLQMGKATQNVTVEETLLLVGIEGFENAFGRSFK